eukprot:Gb_08025 [translate_table: standard]
MQISRGIGTIEIMLHLENLKSQKPRLEIPKFAGKKDGMKVMTRIYNLKQYFSQNPMDKDETIPLSLANESQSSWSKNKKRSEGEMVVKVFVNDKIQNNHLFSILPEVEATSYVVPQDSAQISGGSPNLSTYVPVVTNQKRSSAFRVSNLEILPSSPAPNNSILACKNKGFCAKILLEMKKKLIFDLKKKDDPKGDNCDEEKRFVMVNTIAIDPRGIDYENPFVSTAVLDTYGSPVEKGQNIKGELTRLELQDQEGFSQKVDDQDFVKLLKVTGRYGSKGCFVVSSDTQILIEEQFYFLYGQIKVISSIPEQCQAVFRLENAGIFDDRGNIDADMKGHWNINNKTMIQAVVIKSRTLVVHASVDWNVKKVRQKSSEVDRLGGGGGATFGSHHGSSFQRKVQTALCPVEICIFVIFTEHQIQIRMSAKQQELNLTEVLEIILAAQDVVPIVRNHQLQGSRHSTGGLTEQLLMLKATLLLGGKDIYDQHRDWRLDVHSMTYEELLELGDRLGYLNTGLSEDIIIQCLKKMKHCILDVASACLLSKNEQKCTICHEEYEANDELGRLVQQLFFWRPN